MSKPKSSDGVDFAALYDAHAEYVSRRVAGSFESRQIEIEVQGFKLPHLVALLPGDYRPASVLEIGCATGELIATFPVAPGGRRIGNDISAENIAAARARHPGTEFVAGDFRAIAPRAAECVILSDVLEHVEDDAGFLRDAGRLATRYVLVNLPLEDNWTNSRRRYGPDDASGHLRKYSLAQGMALVQSFDGRLVTWTQDWVHEGAAHEQRKELRREVTGHRYGGSAPVRVVKALVEAAARHVRPFGRRLHPSNLFALLEVRG